MSAPPESSAERSLSRAERAVETVRFLARSPRPAGGDDEARARDYCAQRLRSAGFDVREEPFEYSAFPGRWGTLLGGVLAVVVILIATANGRLGSPGGALVWLTLGGVALAIAARALGRSGVLDFPAARRRSINLVATRVRPASDADDGSTATPAIWIISHLDSKSQPVPILVRAAGITLLGAVWLGAMVVAVAQLLGAVGGSAVWNAVGVLALLGAAPVIATTVGSRSPGALDNASGVATVLAAAEDAASTSFGICLTSAEELGLAGALAWVRRGGRVPGVAINCDTVDDVGVTTCMYSGRRPDALVRSVLAAAARAGAVIRAHRLLPGVLTDGVALADAGWDVVTLSKGSARTLARIHTPGDRADHLTGTGMDEVARVIIELIETGT
jgi:hypothetical protein